MLGAADYGILDPVSLSYFGEIVDTLCGGVSNGLVSEVFMI